MDQRRGEVNVKNRDQEYTMYQETSNNEDWHIHGNLMFSSKKNPTPKDQKHYKELGRQAFTALLIKIHPYMSSMSSEAPSIPRCNVLFTQGPLPGTQGGRPINTITPGIQRASNKGAALHESSAYIP